MQWRIPYITPPEAGRILPPANPLWSRMDRADRLKRLRFRAWHRGTKEADLMIGGFFDRYGAEWGEPEIEWFETFLEEQDVDIMAWALGTQPVPQRFEGEMMRKLRRLDFIQKAE
jgi:antitoxin CptB